tara:strand:+ start:103 stop:348 length:246 start_codon:yes stop_codon:yes gene_type:complete
MLYNTSDVRIIDETNDCILLTAVVECIMTGLTYTAHCTFPFTKDGDKYGIRLDSISGAHKILPISVRMSLVAKVLNMLNYK